MREADVQRVTLNFIILRPKAHGELLFPSEYDYDLDKLRSIEHYPSSLRRSSIQEIQLNNRTFTLLDPPQLFLKEIDKTRLLLDAKPFGFPDNQLSPLD